MLYPPQNRTMESGISFLIDQLAAARALAENDSRRQMLVYLLDLAIVEAEEERELQRSTQSGRLGSIRKD